MHFLQAAGNELATQAIYNPLKTRVQKEMQPKHSHLEVFINMIISSFPLPKKLDDHTLGNQSDE